MHSPSPMLTSPPSVGTPSRAPSSTPRRKSGVARLKREMAQIFADDVEAREATPAATPLADRSNERDSTADAMVGSATRSLLLAAHPSPVQSVGPDELPPHASPQEWTSDEVPAASPEAQEAPAPHESPAAFLERLAAELTDLQEAVPGPLQDRILGLRDAAMLQRSRLADLLGEKAAEGESERSEDTTWAHLEDECTSQAGDTLIRQSSSASTPPAAPSQSASKYASPLTPTYGDIDHYTGRLQARWRGHSLRSSSVGATIERLRQRGRAAHELRVSEGAYAERLSTLLTSFFAPLQRHGVPARRLASLFGNLQVLANLSRMMLAQLSAAADTPASPSAAASATLLALLPSYKAYTLYVSGLASAQQMLASLREQDAAVHELLSTAEASAGATLTSLLVAPARRLPNYGLYVEKMLQLTSLDAAERTTFCRALGAVNELCAIVDASLADHEGRARVAEVAAALGHELKSHPQMGHDGLAVPHRRFICEGPLLELALDEPRSKGTPRHAILFNDMLLVLSCKLSDITRDAAPATPKGKASKRSSKHVIECISLAKVQVKHLPANLGGGSDSARARCSFELWSMAKIWRYAAPSEAERARWVDKLQAQVRFLLASFKQRGKSLAFLPQNVQLLRAQLNALTLEKQTVEQRVLELTAAMCDLDEETQKDRARIARLQRCTRRSFCAGADLRSKLSELQTVKESVETAGAKKAEMQAETDRCVEQLYSLSNALDTTDEQHNDDSLLQFMLFSSA